MIGTCSSAEDNEWGSWAEQCLYPFGQYSEKKEQTQKND